MKMGKHWILKKKKGAFYQCIVVSTGKYVPGSKTVAGFFVIIFHVNYFSFLLTFLKGWIHKCVEYTSDTEVNY